MRQHKFLSTSYIEVIHEAEVQRPKTPTPSGFLNSNSNSVDDHESSAVNYNDKGQPKKKKKYSAMPEEEEEDGQDVIGQVEEGKELIFATGDDVFCKHEEMEMFQDIDNIKARDPDERITNMVGRFTHRSATRCKVSSVCGQCV